MPCFTLTQLHTFTPSTAAQYNHNQTLLGVEWLAHAAEGDEGGESSPVPGPSSCFPACQGIELVTYWSKARFSNQ